MKILSEIFDPSNKEHLLEYDYVRKHGHFKLDSIFLNDNIKFDSLWQVTIPNKISNYYLDLILNN